MKLFKKCKDGGPDSPVDGFFLIEIKSLFSIAVLRFNVGCRSAYHTHAFHALTWFICGDMSEQDIDIGEDYKYRRSLIPKLTKRSKLHRVNSRKTSWCLTIRGPWKDTWTEYDKMNDTTTTLTHGRKVVSCVIGSRY